MKPTHESIKKEIAELTASAVRESDRAVAIIAGEHFTRAGSGDYTRREMAVLMDSDNSLLDHTPVQVRALQRSILDFFYPPYPAQTGVQRQVALRERREAAGIVRREYYATAAQHALLRETLEGVQS
jgi:hypothetical protein